jgi:hypothetical protein
MEGAEFVVAAFGSGSASWKTHFEASPTSPT